MFEIPKELEERYMQAVTEILSLADTHEKADDVLAYLFADPIMQLVASAYKQNASEQVILGVLNRCTKQFSLVMQGTILNVKTGSFEAASKEDLH